MTSTSPAGTGDGNAGGLTTINCLHSDVLTHILRRLDGPTLASTSCATSDLHSLSSQQHLWRNLCQASWPSVGNPRVSYLISTFPSGYRSFFSDSFPQLSPTPTSATHPFPDHLISTVDLHHRNNLILSKVIQTETLTSWFLGSPFRIDALDQRETPPAGENSWKSGDICRNLADDLTLTWIIIDPVHLRAANLSSLRPVSVQRHWFTGEIQVRFATILDRIVEGKPEPVQCGILVTCEGCERGEEVTVREVCLQVEDMEGMNLNGNESLAILQRAMEGERKKRGNDEQGIYLEYLNLKRERKEKKKRKEWWLDMVCTVFGVSFFSALWMFVSFR